MLNPRLQDVKVGDTVIRTLCGMPMKLKVTAIGDGLITCGAWTFDQKTGVEVDHDLQWGPQYGATGSWITPI